MEVELDPQIGVAVLAVVAVLLVVFLFWKRKNAMNQEWEEIPSEEEEKPPGKVDTGLTQGWKASTRGVDYQVSIDPISGRVRIEFPLEDRLVNPLRVEVKAGDAPVSEMSRGLDIRALVSMGACTIDVGSDGMRVWAEMGEGPEPLNQERVEKAISHLIRLRDLSSD